MPASIRSLKSRVRSVKSTKQITRAMQMVAASKMRKAEEADKASTPYVQAANELLSYMASQISVATHPLFQKRDVKARLLIVIAADKGLAGAYNSNILKRYLQELRADDNGHIKNETIAIGRRAAQFVTKIADTIVVGAYQDLPDHLAGNQLQAILTMVIDKFTAGQVDAVDIVYTKFESTFKQNVTVQRILPAGFTETEVSAEVREATYEPTLEEVLEATVARLVGAQIFQALLDGRASEYVMRMMAMKNATDNASDLVDDLTLEMNKARQSAITQELSEISGGVEAMK